ncbi:hypothetical protein N7490_011182 [Penicillium lividum]|nr:hypothetical protein N7490_011182 [Penicillium lividum]
MASFLRQWEPYQQYLRRGRFDLLLPPYERDSEHRVKIYHGELFCRVGGRERGRVPLSATNNLRAHLGRYGFEVQTTPAGRLSQPEKDSVMAWYKGLFDDLRDGQGSHEENEPEE